MVYIIRESQYYRQSTYFKTQWCTFFGISSPDFTLISVLLKFKTHTVDVISRDKVCAGQHSFLCQIQHLAMQIPQSSRWHTQTRREINKEESRVS